MLEDLDVALNESGISLVFAELKDPVRNRVNRYELTRVIDPAHFFPTLDAAVTAFRTDRHPVEPDRAPLRGAARRMPLASTSASGIRLVKAANDDGASSPVARPAALRDVRCGGRSAGENPTCRHTSPH